MSGEHVHVHLHLDDLLGSVHEQLHRIEAKLDVITTTEVQQMADLSAITAEVTENGDAVQSAVILLGDLAQQIRDNATDEAALADLAASLDAQGTALAEAVVANTPAAP